MADLVGQVLGISWQDIWWSMEEWDIERKFPDDDYIHFTFGLCLRDTKDTISVTHEWRPGRESHCGTTHIPKAVIRKLVVYGDGELETGGTEGHGPEPVAPRRGKATKSTAWKPAKRAASAYRGAKKDRAAR